MENTAKTVELLNDLILINNDRIVGFERAIKEIEESDENRDLIPVFLRCIDDSRRFKMELGGEVQVLGHDIEQGTSISGKLHRAWIDVKEAFTDHDRRTLLEECEHGEDAIKKAYYDAMAEGGLPSYIVEMLSDQESVIVDAHDEIRDLRDSVE
jgi:uncharacterized protein (TIGR02284 family)